ncbi:hypothetical protein VM98_33620 [Streptomyces rubellomurinus subsp. indigoferus]|nr:hypothetical protein VM98_33620 [Streptomyces rubellomurinus subsp. indigoferus]
MIRAGAAHAACSQRHSALAGADLEGGPAQPDGRAGPDRGADERPEDRTEGGAEGRTEGRAEPEAES